MPKLGLQHHTNAQLRQRVLSEYQRLAEHSAGDHLDFIGDKCDADRVVHEAATAADSRVDGLLGGESYEDVVGRGAPAEERYLAFVALTHALFVVTALGRRGWLPCRRVLFTLLREADWKKGAAR